jgi:hypothetical protein
MKTLKRSLAVPVALVLCAVIVAVTLAKSAYSDAQQQIEFLTAFYKGYLSRPQIRAHFEMRPGSFYSKHADAALTTNKSLCSTLSRGDEKCGYAVCGDNFLNAHEIAPDLNFQKSQFKAVRSGIDTIDVSFNVWPQQGESEQRTLRYLLVREAAGWRVDDVIVQGDKGFSAQDSMRRWINEENARVLEQASDVSEVLTWVFVHLSQADMVDRVDRFVAFPLQLCDAAGSCKSVARNDARLLKTLGVLHRAYYQTDNEDTRKWNSHFPASPQDHIEGMKLKMDALELTFQGKAWWLTKIDLRALGQTIPVATR